jgi:cyclophilin family peptidyl-prolyl cis-trans isomerase
MADHKQATEVSIATTTDQSEFSSWVLKWWKFGVVGLLVASGALFTSYYQANAAKEKSYASWEVLGAAIPANNPLGFAAADPDELAAVAEAESASISGPWARYLEANARDLGGDKSGAAQSLARLQDDYPDHLLNDLRFSFPDNPTPQTVAERMAAAVEGEAAWKSAHPSLFNNPDPPAAAPTVRMTTNEGPILIALYPEAAPKHVENFLKLCNEGFYNDTKFHRVITGFMIQGGDPNTKEADVDQWGQGGPGYKVDAEDNDLRHFRGYLSAAKMGGDAQSSGSQFFITTGSPHHLDGVHVVFGKVLEGMDTVGIIESGAIALGTQDRPDSPATIVSTETL